MSVVIQAENLSKYYRLGSIGSGTLRADLGRWYANVRGRPDPLLRVDEVHSHDDKDALLWALKDVNFSVTEGEILGIVGRNGAGKSTLLKILSRITAPTKGRVAIRGRVGSLLEVGTGFHPELTGRENIYLNGTILGMKKSEVDRKLDEIVDFSELKKFIDTPVKRYSSGMTVRLAFAVAAHLEPEVLIIDEVLAVGDAAFQRKCLGKMKDVSERGRTVLFVSHNMASISTLCNKGMLLQSGSVLNYGRVDSVLKEYLATTDANLKYVRSHAGGLKPHIQAASVISGSDESEESIKILVEIISGIEAKVSLDFRISDFQGVGIGDWVRGGPLISGGRLRLEKGLNTAIYRISTSCLASGDYFVSIDITDPGIEFFDRVNDCLKFEVIGLGGDDDTSAASQSWGYGSVKFAVQRVDS